MQKPKIFLFFLHVLFTGILFAQQDPVIIEYISKYKELAIAEMQRTGVPASIKLAQGIHETSAGMSDLVKRSNNHFGLKCKSEWKGMTVSHTDDAPNECFRKYETAEESFLDQSDYLKKTQRYSFLFNLDPMDYKAWAYGLKKAGYATNPKYSLIIIKLIEDYKLQDYTMIAMGKMNREDEILAKIETKSGDAKSDIVIPDLKPVVMPPEEEIVVVAKKPAPKRQQDAIVELKPEYPEGEFKINETKVVFAKKGTAYLAIAEKYNVPLARIFEFNELKPAEVVDKDQLIFIMRKRKFGLNELHTVREGETVADIAQTEALRIESLMEYNGLTANARLKEGTILYLRTKSPSNPGAITGK